MPASVMVGTSGICAVRFEDRIAIPFGLAGFDVGQGSRCGIDKQVDRPASRSGNAADDPR
jgi:hypothetical protein